MLDESSYCACKGLRLNDSVRKRIFKCFLALLENTTFIENMAEANEGGNMSGAYFFSIASVIAGIPTKTIFFCVKLF